MDSNFLCVYNFKAWDGYLIESLFPNAQPVDAEPGESAKEVLAKLPSDVTHFAFHLCVSRKDRFPLSRNSLVQELDSRGVSVLNGCVVNTTKRHIHAACQKAGLPYLAASRNGPLDELLVAKSNYNYGAEAERCLEPAQRRALAIEDPSINITHARDYRFIHRCDVPADFWNDQGVIIERYVSNANDFIYRVYVCGQHVVVWRTAERSLLKKLQNVISSEKAFFFKIGRELKCIASEFEYSTTLLTLLGIFIEESRLDFGALDVVYEEPDAYFVIDINDTPYWGGGPHLHSHFLVFLRNGLG